VAPTVADLQAAVNGTLVSGDTELMSREVMGVVVARHDGRPRVGTVARGYGGGDARRPLRRGARRRQCPWPPRGFRRCRASFSTAGSNCTGRPESWWPGCGCGCRSSPPRWAPSRRPARWGRLGAGSPRRRSAKVDTALQLIESHVDLFGLAGAVGDSYSKVTTPQMFTYQLRERARSERKHIVLPEGERRSNPQVGRPITAAGYRRPDHPRRREPDPRPRSRTRRRPGRRSGIRSPHQRLV